MPDQPDYYATIHYGSQGQAVRAPRDWDVDQGDTYYYFEEVQLLGNSSDIYGPGAVAEGKVLLVDSWGGSMVEVGMFAFVFGAAPVQQLHRPARDGCVVTLPRPERFVAGEQCVIRAENQSAAASMVSVFFSGRLVDA